MKWILTYSFLIALGALQAQESKKYIREGNEHYKSEKYEEAIASYEKATEANPDDFAGYLNKGDAYYNSGKWERAEQEFLNAMNRAETDKQKANAWHNLGNTYMEQKKYQQSVKAYKEALKHNPSDEETRYNLAYAQEKLSKQKKNQQNKNKDQKQNQKDQEDKRDQQNKKDNKQDHQKKENKEKQQEQEKNKQQDQQQQQQKEQSEKQKDQQGKPQQPKPIKKEQAERLLRALERQEEKLQEKYNKRKFEIKKGGKTEKDW